MKKDKYNVVQWSSGNVGKASIKGIVDREELNLSGLVVVDEKKKGLDAGVIADIGELGIFATNQPEELLNDDIDCVHYTPLASYRMGDDPEADKKNIINILKKGINVVTTVGFLYPKAFGKDFLDELENACH